MKCSDRWYTAGLYWWSTSRKIS